MVKFTRFHALRLYWNNLVMGMIGATIDPPNMITGVRLVDKLSGPRASNVIRIEVWFTENEDSQAIGTLRKNVEKCFFRALANTSKRMKKISAHAEEMMEALKDFDEKMEKEVRDLSKEEGWTLVDAYIERESTSALKSALEVCNQSSAGRTPGCVAGNS